MKNPFRRLMHYYTYDLRLKTKLIISHTIPFLLPTAVLTGFLILRMYGIIVDDTIRAEQALSAQTVTSIENLAAYIRGAGETLRTNTVVQGLFSRPKSRADSYEITAMRMNNLFYLSKSLTDQDLITDVKIYYDDQAYQDLTQYNRENQELFYPLSSLPDESWPKLFKPSENGSFLSLTSSSFFSPTQVGQLAYTIQIPYENSPSETAGPEETSACLIIYFSQGALEDMLLRNSTLDGEAAFIVNSHRAVVSSSDASLSDMYLADSSQLKKQLDTAHVFKLISFSNTPAYGAYFPIEGTDWHMISIIPDLPIKNTGRMILLQFGAIYGVFAILAFWIAYRLSGSIADRITTVALQMETVRTGPPQLMDISNAGWDEIGVLADTYNYMTKEIHSLMDSQKQTAEDLRNAQFQALQAQINPHFLYNTLDMISWQAKKGDSEKVARAVQTLSRFYKLTLGKGELIHTIKNELEHVSLYVQLQNMRYEECVRFILDVPEELFSYTIPKLTFQPLVENAFLHGIMATQEKKGSILLTGWRMEQDIVFIISDDGAGILPEKLPSLLEEPKKEDLRDSQKSRGVSRHIGVYNTNLRLKSLYGEGYGLSYKSSPQWGTEVTVTIPARQAPEGSGSTRKP